MPTYEHKTWDGTIYGVSTNFENELYEELTKSTSMPSSWSKITWVPSGPKWKVSAAENEENA